MPLLNKEMFDTPPKVGDKVVVTGTVQAVDDKSGDVEVSYDQVENKGDQGDEEGMETPQNASESLDNYMKKAVQ